MALDYTPDTDEVRTIYAVELFQTRHALDHIHDSLSDGDREFDRWLAAHDAEIRKQTLEEAAQIAHMIHYAAECSTDGMLGTGMQSRSNAAFEIRNAIRALGEAR